MAGDQPSAGTTAAISGLLFIITLSGLEKWAGKLASTPQLTILGGFISSLLFLFALIFIGSFQRETKWPEVVLSLVVALSAAATVHRVCITTCFLFSAALLFYVNAVSKHINGTPATTTRAALKRSR